MNYKFIIEKFENSPVVAAIKDDAGLDKCLQCEVNVLFILFGNLNSIAQIVQKAKCSGKIVFVHIDLIDGLAQKEASVDYIKAKTEADGIISTRPNIIKYAKSIGPYTVQRFFVLDSMALNNIRRPDRISGADFIEILPGLMPKVIKMLSNEQSKPLIAGGLISDKDDVVCALSAGAIAVSTTCENVWVL